MIPQRTCVAESQVKNRLTNGSLRVRSNVLAQSIPQRYDVRKSSGVCQYPAKCMAFAVNQGGNADIMFIRP